MIIHLVWSSNPTGATANSTKNLIHVSRSTFKKNKYWKCQWKRSLNIRGMLIWSGAPGLFVLSGAPYYRGNGKIVDLLGPLGLSHVSPGIEASLVSINQMYVDRMS